MKIKILVTDDDASHRSSVSSLLSRWGYETVEAATGKEALAQFQTNQPDIILLDARMPVMGGFGALAELRKMDKTVPIIMMTAYSEVEEAVSAMRMGAWDYLTKPLNFDKLKISLANAAAGRKPVDEPQDSEKNFISSSPAMRELWQMIQTVAPSEATILISGESGTGKELVAVSTHAASHRRNGPFLAINCGAFTETLLASELFGHVKGAFTGASQNHAGIFQQAKGGTIFLDEVGEMPLSMQVKLLRVIQEREVLPVGGKNPIPLDCRIIAATNRDLGSEVEKGNFRADLYYRLNVVNLLVPPLRERPEDIVELSRHFAFEFAKRNCKNFSGISDQALKALASYEWPGNVRELQNVIERAIILMPAEHIDLRELPDRVKTNCASANNPVLQENNNAQLRTDAMPTLEEVKKRVIRETLERCGNNKTEAARILGITRKTLHAKLNKYALEEKQTE